MTATIGNDNLAALKTNLAGWHSNTAKAKATRARAARLRGEPQPCHHPRADHQHGTHLAWKADGCRCQPCTTAARRAEKARRIRAETGRSNYIDAQPSRARAEQLLATLTYGQIEARTGIHHTALKVLLGTFPGRPASRRVTRTTAAALAACSPDPVDPRDHDCLVDPTGTRRRIQALQTLGWTQRELSRRARWSSRTVWVVLNSPTGIRAHTRLQATELYEQLWDSPPPLTPQTSRAQRAAREAGWAPPMAWGDDIDDPAATPEGARPDDYRPAVLDPVEDVLDADPAARWDDVCRRLDRSRSNIETTLKRAGRHDLLARLKRPDDAPLYRTA